MTAVVLWKLGPFALISRQPSSNETIKKMTSSSCSGFPEKSILILMASLELAPFAIAALITSYTSDTFVIFPPL